MRVETREVFTVQTDSQTPCTISGGREWWIAIDRCGPPTVYRRSNAVRNGSRIETYSRILAPWSSVTWSLVRFECQAELNWSPRGLKRLSILLLPLLPPSFPFTPPSLFTVFLSHLVSCLSNGRTLTVCEKRETHLSFGLTSLSLSLSLSFFHSFSFPLLTSL